MNNQLETAPTEFVPQDEASQQGEALNGHKNQREDLAARVCAAEMAVYRAQVQIERRDKVIEALQKQLTELTAGQGQAGREPAADVVEQKAQARCAELEQELGCLRQTRDELANKLTQELKPIAESGGRPQQLEVQTPVGDGGPASEAEQQVRQGVAALARATAELAKERGERQRSEQRTAELNARLEALHQDLSTTLNAQREDLARISALEEEQRQTSQALDRRTADVEQQQSERRLAEEQLQKAKEINAQLRKDLSFYEAANKKFDGARQDLHTRLEAGLSATRANEARLQQENAERQRLAESLEGTQRELQNQTRRRETLEQELQNAHEALEDREARLQKETAERQRLKEALDAVQRNSQDHSERDLEFSKLQSALQIEQVERKRQETQLARARQSALDAAHGARALRTSLRRQIREPVDNLVQSARNMLELEIGDAQKKLAEAVLQDVLLVQTRLREPEPAHGEPAEAATPPATTGT